MSTLSKEAGQSLWQEQLLSALTSSCGAFALALSSIGLYGILAYFLVQRRSEIGLRLAIGANSAQIIQFVAHQVVPTFGIGALAGAALSWFSSQWVRGFLYGVQPFDPVTCLAVAALLLTLAFAGTILPTLRAVRINPALALRQD